MALLPQVCDPADPTLDLLATRKKELETERNTLAATLTSSAHEYKQFDSRWGAIRYGTSSTCTDIAEAGCGPASLAMVINYLYQEDPESLAATGQFEIVTPTQAAAYAGAKGNGRVCNSGTAGDTMVSNVSTGFPGFQGQKISLDQAKAQLRSGNLIIFLCKNCTGQNRSGGNKSYGGHFMVLNGVNEAGTVYNVLDSGANESKDISTITHKELKSNAQGFWTISRQ
ncbi:MAG: C39 family peptidase [Haliscomenobacter sp.]|nr:C39 family peptidase [Haliscomenobacter sp.]MBK9492219.1 C39 family peptidase [Haliscomenobacter sp.]